MNRSFGFLILLGWVLLNSPRLHGRSTDQERPKRLTVLVCDKVGMDLETRLNARKEAANRGRAGIDIVWLDTAGSLDTPTTFNADSSTANRLPVSSTSLS